MRSFSLHAFNEGMTRRAFNRFSLYGSSALGGPWTTVYDTGAGFTYGPGALDLTVNVVPLAGQFFRAEFVQAPWTDGRAVGPRIQELDGYDVFQTSLPLPTDVPEPSTLALLTLTLGLALVMRRRSVPVRS